MSRRDSAAFERLCDYGIDGISFEEQEAFIQQQQSDLEDRADQHRKGDWK